MEDCEALGALADVLQVEGIDWAAVPAHLADEALARAHQAPLQHVVLTQLEDLPKEAHQLEQFKTMDDVT